MEKNNKLLIITIMIITLLIVSVFSVYKLKKKHEQKLYDVMYSKIEYQANKCYLNKDCSENFTLKDLYDKKYLETIYDPISKKAIDEKLEIKIEKGKVIIKK